MQAPIFEQVDHYISALLAPEDEVLLQTIKSLDAHNIPQISVSPNQGKLLQLFSKMCGAKNILELGTLGGYSTIWLARALPENGKVISIEFDERHAAVARKNIEAAGLSAKVEIRVGKALDLLPQIEKENLGPFDLVFIDADKPPYLEYFKWALRLCRAGSIIIADNVIRNGEVLNPNTTDERVQGVQRLNKFISESRDVTATILQTVGIKDHDGMAVAIVN